MVKANGDVQTPIESEVTIANFSPKTNAILATDGQWYKLGRGIELKNLTKDATYKVTLLVPDNPKLNKMIISIGGGEGGESKSKSFSSFKPKYVDNSEGQREGNRRNVAAVLTAALVSAHGLTVQEAIVRYNDIHDKLVEQDANTK